MTEVGHQIGRSQLPNFTIGPTDGHIIFYTTVFIICFTFSVQNTSRFWLLLICLEQFLTHPPSYLLLLASNHMMKILIIFFLLSMYMYLQSKINWHKDNVFEC